jgi:hypothetical protein
VRALNAGAETADAKRGDIGRAAGTSMAICAEATAAKAWARITIGAARKNFFMALLETCN